MAVCKLNCIAWAMRAYVLADAKFHKAEVKVQKKWSLKVDADVAMGEATASGNHKVSTAFKKIQKLHNTHVKERKNEIDFVKRAAKRRRESTDQSEGASGSNAAPSPAKKGKKGGEPYKGKINKVKKDGKGKGKAPQK
ncbi:hypothetical protein SERLA73DRAFT_149174 [Serpula lacrymans var. lacrymans S7.3]|uniref:Uncharacterized protein n=1 Tax=Serpula lacrymans var. lacrymans (strain S7.3) TaxID=936435 RepID=F8PGA4_SERL3|nr:hypothetical protein SERLA73DRAFT_149174 [Serpula lacrymans var. lacrymans S7.3]